MLFVRSFYVFREIEFEVQSLILGYLIMDFDCWENYSYLEQNFFTVQIGPK